MGKTLISINQLSDECGLSPRELSEAIRRGELPAERVAGRWVIDREDADEFLTVECWEEEDDDVEEDECLAEEDHVGNYDDEL